MELEFIAPVLLTLATNVPWVIVAVIGIVIAATRADAHPQVSKLLIGILVAEVGLTVLSAFTIILVPLMMRNGNSSIAELGMLSGGIGLCMSFVRAILLALTLWAALGWRKSVSPS